jgi:hypothetical protein
MFIPRWSTIGLFVLLMIQFVLALAHAKKTARSFREAVLPNALVAAAISIVFAREFFGDLTPWVEAPLAILCLLLILIALGLWLAQLRRYLNGLWTTGGPKR